jgi:hypothetical protein
LSKGRKHTEKEYQQKKNPDQENSVVRNQVVQAVNLFSVSVHSNIHEIFLLAPPGKQVFINVKYTMRILRISYA